ncbi:MAG TPA: LicD family protein [Rectinema sp.]|jgi:lipopolysaccharide cholinephosphotransferase|nr:MAG: LicD family protein [Spirochaetes bacterium ADurb.Bin110]HNV35512.1 LicD family protein [Rectinema sp.]HPW01316.1 LicD family protein [Rectinema sp.]HQN03065.1 LicD family protein [Rectinema sp.]
MNNSLRYLSFPPDNRLSAPDPLRGCQLVMLRLLRIFDAICKELGLCYWLDSGTLLGAVRHRGFIPWDDDLDVAMVDHDYQEFLHKAPFYLPADVFLQHRESDPHYDLPFAKLVDRYSLLDSPDGKKDGALSGIFIDIQPMSFFTYRQKAARKVLYVLHGDYGKPDASRGVQRNVKRAILATFRTIALITSLDHALDSFCAYGAPKWLAYDLSFQRWWPIFHSIDSVFPLQTIQFEGYTFSVPHEIDVYLRAQFGDYMTLPPLEERRPVHSGGIHLTGPNPHPLGLNWKDHP